MQAYSLLLIGDLFLIAVAFILAGAVYLEGQFLTFSWNHASFLMPIYALLAIYNGTYSIKSLGRLSYAMGRVLWAVAAMAALMMFVTFYNRSTEDFSRALLAIGTGISIILLLGYRYVFHHALKRIFGPSMTNILVIDDGGPAIQIPHAFVVKADEHQLSTNMADPTALDRFGRYTMNMDRVVVSCPIGRRPEWTYLLRAGGVEGEVVSETLRALRPIALRKDGDDISLVVSARPLDMRARVIKRVMDTVITGLAAVALAPVFLLICIAIKLDSSGPIFFIQRRMGKSNRFFDMLKFRSMKVEQSDSNGNQSASKDDDRITRVGRFLRKTSLDEIPQLLNVLKGDMSLVGPRPHALGSLAGDKLFWEVDGDYWHRHSLKPGLTGLAQIRGLRGATDEEIDLSRRLSADLEYIANWSPWGDVIIMLKTARVLIHDRAF